MNRPRNRQPRPERGRQGGGQRGGKSSNFGRREPGTPQQAAGTVPRSRQVVQGAGVFIILKEDQPTGRETKGVVQDVLTSGDHPRGIKVRLTDGQVGRVQRLDDGSEPSSGSAGVAVASNSRFSHRYHDVRNDMDHPEEPPARSLADFLPDDSLLASEQGADFGGPSITCPLCEAFEGDEAAVTHHIDREHLS